MAINKLHYCSMRDYVERKRISFPVNWMSVKKCSPCWASLFYGLGISADNSCINFIKSLFFRKEQKRERKARLDKLFKRSLDTLHLSSILGPAVPFRSTFNSKTNANREDSYLFRTDGKAATSRIEEAEKGPWVYARINIVKTPTDMWTWVVVVAFGEESFLLRLLYF